MRFTTLPGFRDFYPDLCSRKVHIFDTWRKSAQSFNFLEYDAPILEPLDLYIEKSGSEITGQLFNFQDRGDRSVALRPELTPSLARMIGAKANSLKRPIKWFNIGENFRYERPQKGRLRSFYQFNADIFGESGPSADAELISLLGNTLQAFGLKDSDFTIRLSDRDIWLLILSSEGIHGADATIVLGIIDKMERSDRSQSIKLLSDVLNQGAEDFMLMIENIMKIRDFASLREMLLNLKLDTARAEQAKLRINQWDNLLSLLSNTCVTNSLQIDLSIVRGLAYYTGFVFEAFESGGKGRALAGGGRYDSLVQKLGGPEIPATGFAMGDVTLSNLLDDRDLLGDVYVKSPDFIAIIGASEISNEALKDTTMLRSLGYSVEYPLKLNSVSKQLKEANRVGATIALIYGTENQTSKNVIVRDLKNKVEHEFDRKLLSELPKDWLANGITAK